ncbi:chemotaxis protein CheX [Aquibacillus koreensis]|uniref:Chemotaxis protein CheX n=1 Tax=Aquibacillus koreensis TaxID=279446 RepID=A0A9X4AJK3_9BACI|nr:chemotaxis protein CheX [Aquibacillus koreensis]MCT2535957.1 chemotaxis protein CheX [Aquibacillus koreensis]MDC3420413.1 chemotaxis protein CheX [Aquibacillus koreensis]
MTTSKEANINHIIKEVYNGTIKSINNVIPIENTIGGPQLIEKPLKVEFGVMIGFTGDLKGELVVKSTSNVFASIGEKMFGMPLSDEMLDSFSGELGNMIAGSLSTQIAESGIHTDITHPTVLNGSTSLSGFKRALLVNVNYPSIGDMQINLLLNQ